MTPLTASGRYVVDSKGRPVYLSGFHTWATVQDGGPTNPPAAFDWTAYLNACVSYGCNFVKLWSCETARGWSDITDIWFYPTYYVRTGPGTANDGGLKFDLTKVNPIWLDRLEQRAKDCLKREIYVCVQLFDGWNIENKGWGGDPWAYHWYNASNNIQGVDGDQDNDGQGTETNYNNGSNVVVGYQEALIEAVIDRLNYLPNIFYEIINETTGGAQNTSWQNRMINKIKSYQAGKPNQHLVMMTFQYPSGSNTDLDNSDADMVCYGANDSGPITSPFTPGSNVVNFFDTDHCGGLVTSWEWIWYSLCRGNAGAWFMDEWDGASYLGVDKRNSGPEVTIRTQLGYALTLTRLLKDMAGMTAQAALCSTGWCLAKNHATQAEFICFQPGTGAFTVNLSSTTGSKTLRWLRCSDGTVTTSTTSSTSATATMTPPASGAHVLYIYH